MGSYVFPSCNHMGAAQDTSGVRALLLVVPLLLLNSPLAPRAGMLIRSFMEGFEGSRSCSAVGKRCPALSFLLLAFILVGSAINPHGLGRKANSDPFKMGAIPPRGVGPEFALCCQ